MRGVKRNFTGGEVTKTLPGRDDLAKYPTSCIMMKNFMPQLHGSARYRPGTRYIDDAAGQAVLIPFEFNTDEEDMYILVFTNTQIRIIQDDGFVSGAPTITSPYLTAELYDIWYEQIGDVVYLTHPNHAPRKLTRSSHTSWALTTVSFASSVSAPTGLAVTWNGAGGGSFTQNFIVTAVSDTGEQSVGSASAGDSSSYPPSEWVAGDYISLSWTAVTGAEEYNIYKEYGGYYGLIGVSGTNSFRDDNYDPDTSVTPPIANNPFASSNHPAVVTVHDQRLMFGGPNANPNTFYGSVTGAYENFNQSRPLKDDDSVEFVIASGKISQIKWMVPFDDLLIGTAGAEYRAKGDGDGAITPVSINVKSQSFWGSGGLRPLVVGNSVIHTQRQNSLVRDLFYSLEKQGYAGNDLSVLASHLFDGYQIVSWAYQQTPDSVVWAVRDDGVLIGMTYMKEHEIWGWHQHTMTDGLFESVAVIGGDDADRVYVTVNDSGTRRIARLAEKWKITDDLEDAWFVDLGLKYDSTATTSVSGLSHLEGETVAVLADGIPVEDLTVSSGAITLPFSASVIIVGRPYTGYFAPMPFEAETRNGTTQGEVRSFGEVILRLLGSLGGAVAAGEVDAEVDDLVFDELVYAQAEWGEAIQPYSGNKAATPAGAGPDHTVYIRQDKPLPFEVLSIIAELDIG